MSRGAACLLVLAALAGCGDSKEDRYDAGFSDGYAVGFNTACEIRATLVAGDWDDDAYAHGYADGQAAGIVDCNASRTADD